jgi:hypothetical protein
LKVNPPMFNLFKKKEGSVKIIDRIWMSQDAKWKGIVELWRKDPSLVIIAWFDSTLRHLETLFSKETTSPVSLFAARTVHSSQITGKPVIFAEHHPMRSKELEVYSQWHLTEAIIHSALDEPLFKLFGSEKIVGMMKQLGMNDDNMIEHKMISSAIVNAQEKIEKKIVAEHSAVSQEEWIAKNL